MNQRTTSLLMLFSRITLFVAVQALFALGIFLAGSPQAWEASAAWWPLTVALADFICLALLVAAFKAEGRRFWDLFRFNRSTFKGDLLVMLGLTVLAAPLSYLPNVLLGTALFGSPETTLDLFVRPLPVWVVYAVIILFPIGQGLSELPTYFGFVSPRLASQGLNKWLAISIPAIMLSLQHIGAPLLFDGRFIAWRGLMFLPFAFLPAIALYFHPRLMPYFVVVHILMNMSFATMFLSAAY